jgi:mannosyltransferase OCH1-like enzyme
MIIHLIAPEDKKKWNPIWHKCYNKWLNTPYDISLWNDEGIDKLLKEDDEKFYSNYLNQLHPIYKFDYVRFIILEKFGGIYSDMDIELIKDFIPQLLPNKIYMMEGDIGELYSNCLMISPSFKDLPTQEVWLSLKLFTKQRVINNFESCKNKHNVIHMVGPFAISEWFAKYFQGFNIPKVGVLSKYHFAQVDSDISFSKHYALSTWTLEKK